MTPMLARGPSALGPGPASLGCTQRGGQDGRPVASMGPPQCPHLAALLWLGPSSLQPTLQGGPRPAGRLPVSTWLSPTHPSCHLWLLPDSGLPREEGHVPADPSGHLRPAEPHDPGSRHGPVSALDAGYHLCSLREGQPDLPFTRPRWAGAGRTEPREAERPTTQMTDGSAGKGGQPRAAARSSWGFLGLKAAILDSRKFP